MNTDALFRVLEPPPGGAEAFAQRLDEIAAERPSPRARVRAAAAAVAAGAVVATILALRTPNDAPPAIVARTPPPVEIYNAAEFDRLLGRPSQPTELTVMSNEGAIGVTEVATTNPNIRIYQIN
jgi:hypothetical protein